jgi:hypothetical protein
VLWIRWQSVVQVAALSPHDEHTLEQLGPDPERTVVTVHAAVASITGVAARRNETSADRRFKRHLPEKGLAPGRRGPARVC